MSNIAIRDFLQTITNLPEDEFTHKLVVPLLEAIHLHPWVTHGTQEKGVDILCEHEDEFGSTKYTAVQVKKAKFTGNASSKDLPTNIVNQLDQALTEPRKNRQGEDIYATRVIFISPYEMNINAINASAQKLLSGSRNKIEVFDGAKLFQIIQNKAPHLFANVGDAIQVYKSKFLDEIAFIDEYSALGLSKRKSLVPVYVELHMQFRESQIYFYYTKNYADEEIRELVTRSELEALEDFNDLCNELLGINPIEIISKDDEPDPATQKIVVTYQAANSKLRNAIKTQLFAPIAAQNKPTEGAEQNRVRWFFDTYTQNFHPVFEHLGFHFMKKSNTNRELVFDSGLSNIDAKELLNSGLNIQLVADGGSGKTTTLKMIAHEVADKPDGKIPLFAYLREFDGNEFGSFLYSSIFKLSPDFSEQKFYELLDEGAFVVFLDGVDEIKSEFSNIDEIIEGFIDDYSSNQFIVSSRNWSALYSEFLLSFQLQDYTDEQLEFFYNQWFAGRMEKLETIEEYLRTEEVGELLRKPLYASLLAVLVENNRTLPASEIELIESRFKLFYGDWDASKSLTRCQFDPKNKRFFLRKIAWQMHEKGRREAGYDFFLEAIPNVIGDIRGQGTAELFLNELIEMNCLITEIAKGKYALGHLKFQEFLAAEEALQNTEAELYEHLEDGWWKGVLYYYAKINLDISQLLKSFMENPVNRYYDINKCVKVLNGLLEIATNTSEALVEKFELFQDELFADSQLEDSHSQFLSEENSFRVPDM